MTDQSIENIKSQRDRALHEAEQERHRAEDAEALLDRAVAEINGLQAKLHDYRRIPVVQIQRDKHNHELNPFRQYDNGD